ncbi:hypothetical protein ACFOW4_10480 [Micromonospora sp. GCM10011542]|uniref:hypothetical protein n=1 Tax=Micromonospora sp. GCM10011542 TaxID=3317337 RepID=UPI0036195536
MDATKAIEPAAPAERLPRDQARGTGFMLGLFGYLIALVAFGCLGILAGGADPGDQLATGIALAYLVALVASVVISVTVRRLRLQHRARMAAGLLGGMAVGVLLLVILSVRIFGLIDEVASTCPCEPIIDQVRFSQG